jgi:predicted XRE-type DNA-binding protein
MIRTDLEYRDALRQIARDTSFQSEERNRLLASGATAQEVQVALDPVNSFHLQLQEDVEEYERLKRGEIGPFTGFGQIGRMLVALRIARGMTQRQLAERLGVHESQVSRDERNEYHGITVERVNRILLAIGAEVTGRVQLVSERPKRMKKSVAQG